MVRSAPKQIWRAAISVCLLLCVGCHMTESAKFPVEPVPAAVARQTRPRRPVRQVAHVERTTPLPPRIRDLDRLHRRKLTLDEAITMALQSSTVIRSAGGRVLTLPDSVRTRLDPATVQSDPMFGPQAALAAFDTQFESGLLWSGGGRSVGSAFSTGPFGIFSQPTSMAKVGIGRQFLTGTQLTIGGVGGYDSQLANGLYAAFGGSVRHPLMRGAGSEINQIAGPFAQPGAYRGVWIAQLQSDKAHLELERATRDLIREVATVYWELHFAFQNLETKRQARAHARQSWEREKARVAQQASPADFEAIAKQQFYLAEAAFKDAISGTGRKPGGVYSVEIRLRALLGLPTHDGTLLQPSTPPIEAEFLFDWHESVSLAQTGRVELKTQQKTLERRELELRASRNLARPQVDLVGQYRRLADRPSGQDALFSQALQGWQIGIEVKRAVANRREWAAVRNAELQLRRAHAILAEQQRQVTSELRLAFTELDRAYEVTQALAVSRRAANARLTAQAKRHAAGQVDIEMLLQSQTRATEAATAFHRSLVDYNLAFIQVHTARGTLLDMLGVGFTQHATLDEIEVTASGRSPFRR